MSTHNLCFGGKKKKIVIPCISQFCYIKVGFEGAFIARTCFPDEKTKTKENHHHHYTLKFSTVLNILGVHEP